MEAANALDPFALWPAFPASDYYGSSAPSRWHQPATDLPSGQQAVLAGEGAIGMVPTFTLEPFDGGDAQLCPCGFATGTPQAFPVASRLATSSGQGVPAAAAPSAAAAVRAAAQPASARFELVVCS